MPDFFSAYQPAAAAGPDFFSAYRPQSVLPFDPFAAYTDGQTPEPDRGFLSSLLHETGQDLTGFVKTPVAALGSGLEALGIEFPITLQDLTTRDLTGAAMIASMFVGGAALHGIRGAKAGVGALGAFSRAGGRGVAEFVANMTWAQRMAQAAGAEAAAGAFFGGMKPLEEEESRLESILSNTAVFAGFGGTFSAMGSAFKATVGARIMELKGQGKIQLLAQAAQREQSRSFLHEFAGVRLRNPDTGQFKNVQRRADGKVVSTFIGEQGTVEETFSDFNAALRTAFDTGYVERFGRPKSGTLSTSAEKLDQGLVQQIRGEGDAALSGKRIEESLGQLDLTQYQAVRELAKRGYQREQLKAWLGAELLTDNVDALGAPVLGASRSEILDYLPRNVARKLSNASDTDVLREGLLHGVVDIQNLGDAANTRNYLQELMVNGLETKGADGLLTYVPTPQADAGFFSKILTPSTLAKIHPELRPLYDLMKNASETHSLRMTQTNTFLNDLRNKVPTPALQRIAQILDDTQDAGSYTEARRIALEAAASNADPRVLEGMQLVTNELGLARLRLVAKGRLGTLDDPAQTDAARSIIARVLDGDPTDAMFAEQAALDTAMQVDEGTAKAVQELLDDAGLAGYFPIVNAGQFKLEIGGEFRGFYKTFREASDALGEEAKKLPEPDEKVLAAAVKTGPGDDEYVMGFNHGVAAEEAAAKFAAEGGAGPFVMQDGFVVSKAGKIRFASRAEAAAIKQRIASGPRGSITRQSIGFDAGALTLLEGREYGKLTKALTETAEISLKEAKEALAEQGVMPTAGPRKFSRFLQERKLGIRTYSEDPFKALSFYLSNIERTLAFDTVEREATAIIGNFPGHKRELRAWAEQQVDLLMGRPTWSERMFQNAVESLPWLKERASPRALKQMSLGLRRYQSWAKLGGAWSGIVNSTQIAITTLPILGARWTGEGMRGIMFGGPKRRRDIIKFFAQNNIDLGLHTPLTKEGTVAGTEGVREHLKSALKRAKMGERRAAGSSLVEAFDNSVLWAFNGIERNNRLVTAWGAYQKGLQELKLSESAALRYAKEIVEKTQFDYHQSNIPQALQGPLGALLGQFKTFFINEVELIASVDNATRAKMLGMMAAVGGVGSVTALPGLDLLDGASRLLFDKKVSEALALTTRDAREMQESENLIGMAVFGLPAIAGIDMSNYVGPGGFNELLRGAWGPTASDVGSLINFATESFKDMKRIGKVSPDTWNAFMQRALPAQLRRIERGTRIISGRSPIFGGAQVQAPGEVRNPYSAKLLYKADHRVFLGLQEMLGAPELEMSLERTVDDFADRQIAHYREAREGYRKQIGLAMSRRDTAAAQGIRQEALKAGIHFDEADMRRALESFTRPADERRKRRTPVDLRTELEDLF